MNPVIFAITFANIALLYMIRTSYSFSKPYLQQQFKTDQFFMSLLDSLCFMCIGIGCMFRFLFASRGNPVKMLAINGVFLCFFYLCYPLFPYFYKNEKGSPKDMLIGCACLCGFFQSFFKPAVRNELKKFKENMCVWECWYSCTHLGKIAGFIYMTIAVVELKLTLLTSTLFLTVCTTFQIAIVYYYLVIKKENQPQSQRAFQRNEHLQQQQNRITFKQFIDFSLECFKQPEKLYFLLLTGCTKAMLENFTYWLPTYLFTHNYKDQTGQISLAFVVPIFAGSFIFSKMYEDTTDKSEQFRNTCIFLTISILLIFSGLIILNVVRMNYVQFVMIIFLEGTVIGGSYNILRLSSIVKEGFDQRQSEMFWTLIQATVNIFTGIVSLVIGIMMKIQQQNKASQAQQCVFMGLLVTSLLSIALLILWIFFTYDKLSREQEDSLSISS